MICAVIREILTRRRRRRKAVRCLRRGAALISVLYFVINILFSNRGGSTRKGTAVSGCRRVGGSEVC